jgi:hypothetical protein
MPSKCDTSWLPLDIIEVYQKSVSSSTDPKLSQLRAALLANFGSDGIWKISVGKQGQLTWDQWMQVVAPLFASQFIAIREARPLVCTLRVTPSLTSESNKLKVKVRVTFFFPCSNPIRLPVACCRGCQVSYEGYKEKMEHSQVECYGAPESRK